MDFEIQFDRGIWFAPLRRDQAAARQTLKEAGFKFCWGAQSGKCWRYCKACKLGLKFVWYTDKAAVAEKFFDHLSPAAKAAVERFRQTEKQSRAVAADINISVPAPSGLKYLGYQTAGIAWMTNRRATLLGDEMGLGKTIQVLGLINSDQSISNVLVLCPASLRLNWVREAEKWLTRTAEAKVVDKVDDLCDPAPPGRVCLVSVNYERLIKSRGKGLFDLLMSRTWDLLVCDEAHRIKNPKAKQSQAVLGVSARGKDRVQGLIDRSQRKAFLTGTPIANRPVELWPLIHALRPDIWGSFFSFAKRYCNAQQVQVARNKWVWDFTGASNLEDLQLRLRTDGGGLMIRRLKRDVLKELPPKVRNVHVLPVDSKVKAILQDQLSQFEQVEEAIDVAQAELELGRSKGEDVSSVVAKLRSAKQLAFEEMSKGRSDVGLAKIDPATEYIEEVLEGGVDKLVVFAHHKEVIAQLEQNLARFRPVIMTGATPLPERQRAVDLFQQDRSVRVFLGNIQAAGVGITLTAASHVVFVETDWVPANLVQAEDRCHRIGQADSVFVTYLVFDGSLDAKLLKTIVHKMDLADQALDKTREAEALDDALDEALTKVSKLKEPVQVTYTQKQRATALSALQQLASVCDGARTKDNVGFAGCWVRPGHWLANQSELTDRQMAIAKRILVWHHRQVPEGVLSLLGEKPPVDVKKKGKGKKSCKRPTTTTGKRG